MTVKAYPTVSQQHGEAVCVAGIRTDVIPHRWVRLFPVHYRDLPEEQQFKKWEFIELDVQRGSDTRPESYVPILETIRRGRVLGTGDGWAERRTIVDPLLQSSLCVVRRQRKIDGTSLALVRAQDLQAEVRRGGGAEQCPQRHGGIGVR
ncbi:hypothetical protein [Frankia sp. Cj3]|uniref:hypothetical protein n=1 Tax=Frankia sp. Cj3 TaxID=2880976 RepID=UPI001EF6ED9A|nr:hypothetical protein [Frankia sp. Cj3]